MVIDCHAYRSAENLRSVVAPPDQRRLKAQKSKTLLPVSLRNERGPDGLAFRGRLDQPMRLEFVEHRDVG